MAFNIASWQKKQKQDMPTESRWQGRSSMKRNLSDESKPAINPACIDELNYRNSSTANYNDHAV
jgi:hypothetical protein